MRSTTSPPGFTKFRPIGVNSLASEQTFKQKTKVRIFPCLPLTTASYRTNRVKAGSRESMTWFGNKNKERERERERERDRGKERGAEGERAWQIKSESIR